MILTHPNNKKLLEERFETQLVFHGILTPFDEHSIRIVFDECVPERQIKEVWHPPVQFDRFVEYGYEDECWMRPLGLGWIDRIDHGPLFIEMDDSPLFSNSPLIRFPVPTGVIAYASKLRGMIAGSTNML